MSASRRAFLGLCAASPLALSAAPVPARGRLPVGGRLALRAPWPLAAIDPHAEDDVAAALLGGALFDTLPALAEEPERGPSAVRMTLRAGLLTASGRPLGARDAVLSLARARAAGAAAWLADVPAPRRDGDALVFETKDAARLFEALSSPLCAIVPIGFSPAAPDGTGPFRAERLRGALVLSRNPRAARGPALLDAVELAPAPDLAASLRAFEAGADDLGWLGLGLHAPRAGAKPFDAGAIGWTILRTGKDAGAWDAPGVAQRLCDGLDPARLAYLVPGAAWEVQPSAGWGGGPCDLIVRNDAPYLVEVARAVAAMLSRPSHEVKLVEVSPADFATRRASRAFALAVDAARPLAPGGFGALVGLATADDPAVAADLVRHPPKLAAASARAWARTMRLGVVGEIRVQGGRAADVNVALAAPGFGWDLGASTRGERR